MADQKQQQKEFERERKKRYRKKHKTFTVIYSLDEAKELKQKADVYNVTIPEYIKLVVRGHMYGNGYVTPSEQNISALIVAFRKIGNNLNQVVRHINTAREVTFQDIELMQNHLFHLEKQIMQALSFPPEITQIIGDYISKNPDKLPALINWFSTYTNDYKNSTG